MGSGILFYVTLLVAVAAGWSIAWVSLRSRYQSKRSVKDIYHDYFVGLNYLLGDEFKFKFLPFKVGRIPDRAYIHQ